MYTMGTYPGGPVVKTLSFNCRGRGLIPRGGTRILHVCPVVSTHTKKKKEEKHRVGENLSNEYNQ